MYARNISSNAMKYLHVAIPPRTLHGKFMILGALLMDTDGVNPTCVSNTILE